MPYVNTKTACEKIGVHPNTLRNWDKKGLIKVQRTPGGVRLYDLDSLNSAINKKSKIIYARVSSRGQKDDLCKQIQYLKERYPNHELIEDIGSGLNFKRRGFKTLLERLLSGDVEEVVVCHKDRLARFGFDIIQGVASYHNCKLVVLSETVLSPESELVQDLLSIIHVFSCRLYGLRKYCNKVKEDKDLPQKQAINE